MIGQPKIEEFVMLLQQLDTTMLIGVAKILGVQLLEQKSEVPTENTDVGDERDGGDRMARDGEQIIFDMINTFATLPRRSRRELLRTMRAAVSKKEDKQNGSTT